MKRRMSLSAQVLASAAWIIVATLMPVSETIGEEPFMRLYFVVPFSIETYTPVTMENIGTEFGRTILLMEERGFTLELVTMLESHPTNKEILANGIRLKADLGDLGATYFVDKEGTVLKKGSGATFQLSADELARLEKQLEPLIGVVDVESYRRHKKEK
jgi:hypothetical protein